MHTAAGGPTNLRGTTTHMRTIDRELVVLLVEEVIAIRSTCDFRARTVAAAIRNGENLDDECDVIRSDPASMGSNDDGVMNQENESDDINIMSSSRDDHMENDRVAAAKDITLQKETIRVGDDERISSPSIMEKRIKSVFELEYFDTPLWGFKLVCDVFTNCFQKVDDEVGGKISRKTTPEEITSEPVAPETVGSTAVVALICSSHIIVANCGDSRAVLYRGKEAMVLSNDHKPNREDEYARIEAAGGKVIQRNGHRVFGVLAMSRSIGESVLKIDVVDAFGDRYLKPWIIPEPEVTFTARAREDECLVLASDGLWDVMSNEEVCEVARKRILIWHKKNGGSTAVTGGGTAADPAAQAAADYLAMAALQKGSKDNVSVIVVDLKTKRKFKTKS